MNKNKKLTLSILLVLTAISLTGCGTNSERVEVVDEFDIAFLSTMNF